MGQTVGQIGHFLLSRTIPQSSTDTSYFFSPEDLIAAELTTLVYLTELTYGGTEETTGLEGSHLLGLQGKAA